MCVCVYIYVYHTVYHTYVCMCAKLCVCMYTKYGELAV